MARALEQQIEAVDAVLFVRSGHSLLKKDASTILTGIDIGVHNFIYRYSSMNQIGDSNLSFTFWRIMYLSEDFFPHLVEAKERARRLDLERRRVRLERQGSTPGFGAHVEKWSRSVVSQIGHREQHATTQRQANCVECLA